MPGSRSLPPRLMTFCKTSGNSATSKISANSDEGIFRYLGAGSCFLWRPYSSRRQPGCIHALRQGGCRLRSASLVEVYSALTRMPGKHRINSDQAMLFIGSILERLTIVALDADEYVTMLNQFSGM